MTTIKTKQFFSIEGLPNSLDFFICSSGYESRAVHIFDQCKKRQIENKICFAFKENIDEIRIQNDVFFTENDFKTFTVDGNSSSEILNILAAFFKIPFTKKIYNIVVDYSCMTRLWYGEIINFFKKKAQIEVSFNLFFLYSLGEYIPPEENDIYNSYVAPIKGYSTLSVPERPTALIIGLGYEKNRAYSLKEYLDAEEVYLFIAENEDNELFIQSVYNENNLLIDQIGEENIFHYPIKDLAYTELVLKGLCESLLNNYRIVLAPCGPKPFTLLSFVTALKLSEIDVWRVSAGASAPIVDKKPTGEILCYLLQIICDSQSK